MTTIFKIVFSVSAICSSFAFAADIPDSGRLLRESVPNTVFEPRKELPEIQKPVEHKESVQSGIRVKVNGFTFTGNSIFSNTDLTGLMSGYIGKELTLTELNAVAGTITNVYREKGYFLASAFIPPQTIKNGTLINIEVVEGVLEGVVLDTSPAEPRVPKSTLRSYADRVPVNKPAEEGSISSMVMMINELPNISSRILLEPGVRPGTTKATLKVSEGKPYALYLDTDNHGNYSTGYYRVGAGLDLFSPLRLGDQLTLRVQTATSGDSQNFRASYTIPVAHYGTKIGFDYSYVAYQLGRSFKPLNGNGDAHSFALTVTQPLVRSRNLILNATLAGESKLLDDRIDSVNSKNKRHTASWQAGFSGVEMDTFLGGGSTSFSLGFIGGNLGIGDSTALSNDQAPTGLRTNGGYSKISMNLARTQMLYKQISLFAGSYGQWADKNLDSAEQISMGGPSAVRAFQTGDSSGDSGFVSTAELRYLVGQINNIPGSFQFTGFVDYGHSVLHSNPIPGSTDNTRNLTGAGLGGSWFSADSFSIRTTVAWKVAGETRPVDSPMFYFQAVKRF